MEKRFAYLLAACALVSAAGLSCMDVTPAYLSGLFKSGLVALALIGLGAAVARWQHRLPRFAFALGVSGRFYTAFGQMLAFLVVSFPLTYIAAFASGPLVDAHLLSLDHAIGFDWPAVRAWCESHPLVLLVLWMAYGSYFAQLLACVIAHSARKSTEYLWLFALTLLLTIAVSVFTPALGHPGLLGSGHIEVFEAARAGLVNEHSGIITFPSFHAAAAVVFIYASRIVRPLFAVFVPLNILMILATPPCGGHYVVDTIAGIGVALVAIAITRRMRAPSAERGLNKYPLVTAHG